MLVILHSDCKGTAFFLELPNLFSIFHLFLNKMTFFSVCCDIVVKA